MVQFISQRTPQLLLLGYLMLALSPYANGQEEPGEILNNNSSITSLDVDNLENDILTPVNPDGNNNIMFPNVNKTSNRTIICVPPGTGGSSLFPPSSTLGRDTGRFSSSTHEITPDCIPIPEYKYWSLEEYDLLFNSSQLKCNTTAQKGCGIQDQFQNYMEGVTKVMVDLGLINIDPQVLLNATNTYAHLFDSWSNSTNTTNTTQYTFHYGMLFGSDDWNVERWNNVYKTIMQIPQYREELQDYLNLWLNVSDVDVVDILSTTSTPAPTMAPTSSKENGAYELTFDAYNVPVGSFSNVTPACQIMIKLSTEMSESEQFNHNPNEIQVRCTGTSTAFIKNDVDELFRGPAARLLIPAEFEIDEEDDMMEEDTYTTPSLRSHGQQEQRRLQQELPYSDTLPSNQTLPPNATLLPATNITIPVVNVTNKDPILEVRFDLHMTWESDQYNLSEYPREFRRYVRSVVGYDNLEIMLEIVYDLPDDAVLDNMRFRQQVSAASDAPVMVPTAAPTRAPMETVIVIGDGNSTIGNGTLIPTIEEAIIDKVEENNNNNNNEDSSNPTTIIVVVVVVMFFVLVSASGLGYLQFQRIQNKLSDLSKQQQPEGSVSKPEPEQEQQQQLHSTTAMPSDSLLIPIGDSTNDFAASNNLPRGPTNEYSGIMSARSTSHPEYPPTVTDASMAATVSSMGMVSTESTEYATARAEASRPGEAINRVSASGMTASTSTFDGTPQDFAFPGMSVQDISGGGPVAVLPMMSVRSLSGDEAAAAERERQSFLDFLPDIQENPSITGLTSLTLGVDEFEYYKDPNLEKMRQSVENNVAGLDNMMSQAMARALMDSDTNPPTFGDHPGQNLSGAEIEASALCEVTEWVRRHEDASNYQKEGYMQELLKKMVSCVRAGIVAPEDASRSIHGCASLLGLELAHELPNTTILLVSMLKTTTERDIRKAFAQFGRIQDAAVAAGEKGFGLVRFYNSRSVDAAMEKFRVSEVVVNNVAIQLVPLVAGTGFFSAV